MREYESKVVPSKSTSLLLTTKLKASLTPALAGMGLSSAQQSAIAAAGSHGTLDPSVLNGLSPEKIGQVTAAFDQAFMAGFHVALLIGGVVLMIAALIAHRFIPGRKAVPVMAPGERAAVAVEA